MLQENQVHTVEHSVILLTILSRRLVLFCYDDNISLLVEHLMNEDSQ